MMKRSQSVQIKKNTLASSKSLSSKGRLKGIKSRSDDSLDSPKRKASTPTREANAARPVSPDISCIMADETLSSGSGKSTAVKKLQPKLGTSTKRGTGKEEDLDDEDLDDKLSFEYSRLIQLMTMKKIAEREASEIDENLSNLKKRIEQNQIILEKTTERLKNVTFNKEVDLLHSLRNPNHGKVLENLESTKCREYLETLNEKLEKTQNQLRVKNIQVAKGGGAELLDVFNETLASCEKLKDSNTLELPRLMEDIQKTNRDTTEILSKCLDRIPQVEDRMLTRAVLDISKNVNPL